MSRTQFAAAERALRSRLAKLIDEEPMLRGTLSVRHVWESRLSVHPRPETSGVVLEFEPGGENPADIHPCRVGNANPAVGRQLSPGTGFVGGGFGVGAGASE